MNKAENRLDSDVASSNTAENHESKQLNIDVSEEHKDPTHFIAIHLGAGYHSLKMYKAYKSLCKSAIEAGLRILRNGGTASKAVVAATMILENSGIVNAGKGSNLTIEKTVECDAGFMNGLGCFGGVGAVQGAPNPVLIAEKIAELQAPENKLSCGRVPPIFLVGEGANKWGAAQGIPTCDPLDLVSKKGLKRHAKYMDLVDNVEKLEKRQWFNFSEEIGDTIGVIALDNCTNVAATVSSGGNWLKIPGRVGHSPQFGCGCWAKNQSSESDHSIAISTTGVGEMLSKVQWASECANLMESDEFPTSVEAISHAIKSKFLESHLIKESKEPKIVGVIGLTWDGQSGEFVWGHSSDSFVVAYGGKRCKRVQMIFSRFDSTSDVDKEKYRHIKVEGIPL